MKVNGIALAGVACALLLSAWGEVSAQQPQPQLNQNCTVSVLNRTVTANADGTWILPNVPANFGPVRARVTCVVNGQTIAGESDAFVVPANGVVNIPPIRFGQTTPIPTALTIAPPGTLSQAGQAVQLAVTARYSDGSTRDVTAAAAGTTYTVSNSAIATVSGDGIVQAVSSGTVIVQASHEGASGMTSIRVAFGGGNDTDGDGIPDADEVLLGLNPNNAVDAMEDFDRDNLTNLQEYQLGTDLRNADTDRDGLRDGDEVTRGTNPLLFDTDGDGVSDGLEVLTGSDPLDPGSVNLPGALSRISITPASFTLTFNTIAADVAVPLRVTGTLRDGTTLDLTQRGTNYSSSNLTICSFSATPGLVFAGQAGDCVITATVAGFSATATGTVHTFSPIPLSSVGLPGPVYGVDVSGDAALVATGGSGVQIVDVSDRAAPRVAASMPLPGTALDVKVDGTRAYVAAGDGGLHILDVSDLLSPRLLGSIDTPGSASDVRVRGGVAYVADGDGGLQIIDVSDASHPRIIGVAATGPAIGVDLTGTLAVVAQGALGVTVVGIANPSVPIVLGSVDTPGDARDVVAHGDFAYVADYTGSLRAIDLRNPAAPVLAGTTPPALGGMLLDVARADSFVFGADVFFVNGVPIVDVSDPQNLRPRAILNFPGDATGTGIAVDGSYVYLGTDTSRLYIGQYRIQEDLNGIPPAVSIVSPASGSTFVHGESIPVAVDALDDLAVVQVALQVDGVTVATDTTAPYQFNVVAPAQDGLMLFGATALDLGNNVGTSAGVVVNVIADPLTTIIGRVLSNGSPFAGAAVVCNGVSATTGVGGTFTLSQVRTVPRMTGCAIAGVGGDGTVLRGVTAATLVRGGVTDLGDIVIAPVPVILSIAPRVFDATNPPAFLRVTGTNLTGATFEFLGPAGQVIAIGQPQVNAPGTEATLPVTIAPTTRGRFTLVGTNQFGGADPAPTLGNTVIAINAQDDGDTDGDGYPDGLELLLGSDPADALSIPAAAAREDTFRFSVVNSTFPSEVARTSMQWFSVSNTTFPAAVQRSSIQWFSLLNTFVPPHQQTLVSSSVSVLNEPISLLSSRAQETELSIVLTGVGTGRRLVEGETLTVGATVSGGDGTEVASFTVNGVPFAVAAQAPYEMLFTVPAGARELTFGGTVRGANGRVAPAPTVAIGVDPDPGTSVAGRVVNAQGQPVANALVEVHSSGLRVEYFDTPETLASLPDVTGLTLIRSTRVTAINTRAPAGLFGPDPLGTRLAPDYAARFTGWLSVAIPGSYRFFLGADEGARLTVGGAAVVDMSNPAASGFQESSGVVDLPVGLVPIEITFYQSTGNAELQLSVAPPGSTRRVVPPSALIPASAPFAVRTDADGRFTVPSVPLALEDVRVVVTPPTDIDGGVILPVAGRLPAAGVDVGDSSLPRRP